MYFVFARILFTVGLIALCGDDLMPYILTLDEIAEELHAGEDPSNIILFPPDDGVVTDEGSEDENEANILYLPSRMLRSQVEIQSKPFVFRENFLYQEEEEKDEVEEEKMKVP